MSASRDVSSCEIRTPPSDAILKSAHESRVTLAEEPNLIREHQRHVVDVSVSRSRSRLREPMARRSSRSRSTSPAEDANELRCLNHGHNSSLRVRERPPTSENKVLAVFGLHLDVTEQELDGLYRPYGATYTKIIKDKHRKTSKGYGFIYFNRTAEAVKAKKATEGLKLRNKEFRLDYSLGERDFSQMIMSRRTSPPAHRRHPEIARERREPLSSPFSYEKSRSLDQHIEARRGHHNDSPRHHHDRHHHYDALPRYESYRARENPRLMTREIRRKDERERSPSRYAYREQPEAISTRYMPHHSKGRSVHSDGSNSSSRNGAMTPPSPRFVRRPVSRSRSRSREDRFVRREATITGMRLIRA